MITPFLRGGRSVYYISFRHPATKKQVNRSLGTSDEHEARSIALDVERIFRNPDAWDIAHPVLLTFPDSAVRAFHGCSARVPAVTIPLPEGLVNAVAAARHYPVNVSVVNPQASGDAKTNAELRQQVIDRDIKIAHLEDELDGWRRRFNAHVSIPLARAVEMWKATYVDRADETTKDVCDRVDEFVAHVGGVTKLGDVQGSHVDSWLAVYRVARASSRKDKDGIPIMLPALEPRSLRRRRGCVSIFLNWCARKYKMNSTAIDHAEPIVGVPVEYIVAIRRLPELRALFAALDGYWQAVIALGCLSGLRLAEIIWLKKTDIYVDEKYLRVTSRDGILRKKGTKTRKERSVPIERTTLLPILEKYIASNGAGSWRDEWPWAFPTLVETPYGVIRTKTPNGIWSNGNNFRKNCDDVLAQARAKSIGFQSADFWGHGSREWRHTAGTAMALSGLSALAISKVLGNTEEVCERHYIGMRAEDIGTRWPFQW